MPLSVQTHVSAITPSQLLDHNRLCNSLPVHIRQPALTVDSG